MDWIVQNFYVVVVSIGFIGAVAVNFYRQGKMEKDFDLRLEKLEKHIERNEEDNKRMIEKLFDELKELRKEMNANFMLVMSNKNKDGNG